MYVNAATIKNNHTIRKSINATKRKPIFYRHILSTVNYCQTLTIRLK